MRDRVSGLLVTTGNGQPLPGTEGLQRQYSALIRKYNRELKVNNSWRGDLLAQAARVRVLIYEGAK